jgi:hypothetical protein
MLAMGYSLYPVFPSGLFDDTVTVARGLVFCGFAYLLVASLTEIVKSQDQGNQSR